MPAARPGDALTPSATRSPSKCPSDAAALGAWNVRRISSASDAASAVSGSGAAPSTLCRRSTSSPLQPSGRRSRSSRLRRLPAVSTRRRPRWRRRAAASHRVAQRVQRDAVSPSGTRACSTGKPLRLPLVRKRTCRSMSGTTCARCAAAAMASASDSMSATNCSTSCTRAKPLAGRRRKPDGKRTISPGRSPHAPAPAPSRRGRPGPGDRRRRRGRRLDPKRDHAVLQRRRHLGRRSTVKRSR